MSNEPIGHFYEIIAKDYYHPSSNIEGLINRKGFRKFISFDDRFLEVKKVLERLIGEKFGKYNRLVRVLDVGCGDGVYEKIINQETRSKAVFDGADISSNQKLVSINLFKDFFQINLDNDDIPVEDEKYDLVICSEILEHLFFPDRLLKEIARVLKQDGLVVVTAPNAAAFRNIFMMITGDVRAMFYPREKQHIRFFNLSGLKKIMSDANLQVINITGVGALLLENFNFYFKVYTPRLLQIIVNRLIPARCPGVLLICCKKHG